MSKGSRSFYELTMALAHKAMQTNSAIWNMTSTTKSQFNANNNKCIQLLEMSMKTATPEKSTNEPLFTNSQRAGQKPTEHNSSFQPLSAKATATTSTATNLPRRMNLQSGQKFRIKLAAIRKLKSQDEDQILREYPHLQLKRCFVSLVRVDEAAIAADKRKISNVPGECNALLDSQIPANDAYFRVNLMMPLVMRVATSVVERQATFHPIHIQFISMFIVCLFSSEVNTILIQPNFLFLLQTNRRSRTSLMASNASEILKKCRKPKSRSVSPMISDRLSGHAKQQIEYGQTTIDCRRTVSTWKKNSC